jgi:glutathione S-transferase
MSTLCAWVLAHKGVPFEFRDLEAEMGEPGHLALHPFGGVPILDHDGFRIYETAAIASYVDEAFDGPSLQPTNAKARERMHQWISALNSYYYPYIAFHLGHERLIYPALGIAPDEKVVAVALPKIANRSGRDGGRAFQGPRLPRRRPADLGRLLPVADHDHTQPDPGRP